MPFAHCRYIAVQKHQWWNCPQNPFAELTLIYGSQDRSLDIWNISHTVHWFSLGPKRQLRSNALQTRSCGWTISSWTTSAHAKWYHKFLSVADLIPSSYQQYCRWWLQSQHRINGPEISPPCRRFCLPHHKPLVLQQSSYEQVCWRIWFWDRLP